MLLYAGITSFSFKYLKFSQILVTILKQRSQSAGNFVSYLKLVKNNLFYLTNFNKYKSSSETLRNKSELPNSCKKVSVHEPIQSKPLTDNEFGHYLAGLIDGDGHFSKTPQLVIVFNQLDASLAYYIKGRIGYGNIYKVKKKEAVILVV